MLRWAIIYLAGSSKAATPACTRPNHLRCSPYTNSVDREGQIAALSGHWDHGIGSIGPGPGCGSQFCHGAPRTSIVSPLDLLRFGASCWRSGSMENAANPEAYQVRELQR
ncbi:hypothetical protein F4777DRAFT_490162 [Nemania sp. FL0916]|nr:hypothetical protein F4777DRAFT_490162 [Nemania sp. FL0916]